MPKLDRVKWESTNESAGGDFKRLEPCVAMCQVQAVRTKWKDSRGVEHTSDEKQYVKLIVDIVEGDFAGEFSRDFWAGEDKDYGHTLYMSWSERALGMLKHTFRAFDEANPGFDSMAAFEADKWGMFVGKRVLVCWNGEEYDANDGSVKLRVRPDRALTSSDNARPRVTTKDGRRIDWADYSAVQRETPSAAYSDEDIPFM